MTLSDIQLKTAAIVGPVRWEADGTNGLCACPGAAMHTSRSNPADCTVFIEGAPTIYCFHSTCSPAVASANLRLRRSLGGQAWSLILPDGSLLRSGEARVPAGQPIPPPAPKNSPAADSEKKTLRDIALHMGVLKERLLETFAWDPADMWEDSPVRLTGDVETDWKSWLTLWHPDDVVWVGSTFDSGQGKHRENFRPASEWALVDTPPGQFTCGSAFSVGTFSRKNEHAHRRFMVIESDVLTRAQIGAVFQWLRKKFGYTLHAIVNTGGKSLHGWFDLPPHPTYESRLKVALTALGCDPALFKPSQPVRVPGAYRDANVIQSLLWLRSTTTSQSRPA